MKRGKKVIEANKKVDRMALYDVTEAFDLVKDCAHAKFDESVEVHRLEHIAACHDRKEDIDKDQNDEHRIFL